LVSIGLGRLRQQVSAQAVAGPVADILRLQEQASSIGRTLREISHQLHPAALEQVGLSAALRLQCEEVREATGMAVHMVNHGDTATVPPEAALCVYRVAQEALTNVIRHSGAQRVDLLLRRDDHRLVLEVTDDGCGVTPGPGVAAHGLGLRSAAERADAVGGALTLETSPGAGTTVRMIVPFGQLSDA
jgi:two-component system sensor histidine kinase UhpB